MPGQLRKDTEGATGTVGQPEIWLASKDASSDNAQGADIAEPLG